MKKLLLFTALLLTTLVSYCQFPNNVVNTTAVTDSSYQIILTNSPSSIYGNRIVLEWVKAYRIGVGLNILGANWRTFYEDTVRFTKFRAGVRNDGHITQVLHLKDSNLAASPVSNIYTSDLTNDANFLVPASITGKMNYTDTAPMLTNLLRKTDTASMVANLLRRSDTATMIANLLRKSDTASMLAMLLRKSDTAIMMINLLRKSDTAIMLTNMLRKTDTAYMLLNLLRKSDTAAMVLNLLRKSDTAYMMNNLLRKSDTATMLANLLRKSDSTVMLINLLRKSDTAYMLMNLLRKSDTAYMLVNLLRKSDTAAMLAGYQLKRAIHNTITRTLNSSFQVSTTKDAVVRYTAKIVCALSLSGGQSGAISLRISPDGSTWTTIGQIVNENSGSLVIGVAINNTNGSQVTADVPLGWYVKLETSGTGTFTYLFGQETY